MNSKTIFVTGATGNQGGAVARNLIRNGFHVKALTRNPSSKRGIELKNLNVEIVKGDLNDPETFRVHLQNVDGIFSVQTFFDGIAKEIKQGCQLIDLAKEFAIPHFVYTSVSGADLKTGIPHWESKNEIEQHLKMSGIPFTIVRPSSLFENFLIPEVHSRIMKGKLVSPVGGKVIQQFTCAADVGDLVLKIFNEPATYKGETITLASQEMNLETAAEMFTKELDRRIVYSKLPMLITRLVMGRDLYKMFKWVNENGGVFPKDPKQHNPLLKTGLSTWIQQHIADFKKV
jgi:uncharacterized protein YbjT (DUF2867 family)